MSEELKRRAGESKSSFAVRVIADERGRLQRRVIDLEDALIKITEIEDEQHGGDWDEIEEARRIAAEALK